jgi:thiamine-monophosphate kinase
LKLKELGEFKLIDRIRQRASYDPDVHRGIGDDAAVVKIPPGHSLLTSTDMLVEDVHFRHAWTSPWQLGRKAVAVNISDIAAMGGTPRFLYLGLACPEDADIGMLTDFMDGVITEAGRYEVCLAGGDTCRSPGPWVISVTIEGSLQAGTEIGRDGAKPGDRVMVSGTIGDSALALHMLSIGSDLEPELADRHHSPSPRVELGRRLAEQQLATAMIDVSDGLAGDLEHILQSSVVDACINESLLPRSTHFREQVQRHQQLLEQVRFGGEDYELLFTVAPQNVARVNRLGNEMGLLITEIGVITEGSGNLTIRDDAGDERPGIVSGYDHFGHSWG